MKAFSFLTLLFLFFLNPSGFSQSKQEKAVAAAVEELRQAMISGNADQLAAITTDDLVYGHSSAKVENKKEFIAAFVNGSSDFVTIDLSEQVIHVYKKAAVVRHILYATNNDKGRPGTVKLSILTTWVKESGRWKLAARQAVRIT